jgi:hypothetical protein
MFSAKAQGMCSIIPVCIHYEMLHLQNAFECICIQYIRITQPQFARRENALFLKLFKVPPPQRAE